MLSAKLEDAPEAGAFFFAVGVVRVRREQRRGGEQRRVVRLRVHAPDARAHLKARHLREGLRFNQKQVKTVYVYGSWRGATHRRRRAQRARDVRRVRGGAWAEVLKKNRGSRGKCGTASVCATLGESGYRVA